MLRPCITPPGSPAREHPEDRSSPASSSSHLKTGGRSPDRPQAAYGSAHLGKQLPGGNPGVIPCQPTRLLLLFWAWLTVLCTPPPIPEIQRVSRGPVRLWGRRACQKCLAQGLKHRSCSRNGSSWFSGEISTIPEALAV